MTLHHPNAMSIYIFCILYTHVIFILYVFIHLNFPTITDLTFLIIYINK